MFGGRAESAIEELIALLTRIAVALESIAKERNT